jgi:hypothetical protein
MAITAYRGLEVTGLDGFNAGVTTLIGLGWSPYGPVLHYQDLYFQVMIKGTPDAGTVTSDEISDAGALGREVLKADDLTAFFAATTSTFPPIIGTQSNQAKAGNWFPNWDDLRAMPTKVAAGNTPDDALTAVGMTTVGKALCLAADATAARTAIGSGTSDLQLGTTSTTAKSGNWKPGPTDMNVNSVIQQFLSGTSGSDALEKLGCGLFFSQLLAPTADQDGALTALGASALGKAIFAADTAAHAWDPLSVGALGVDPAKPLATDAVSGIASLAAREDHVHPFPADATGSASGFMAAADKTKLDGIAASATSNLKQPVFANIGAAPSMEDFNNLLAALRSAEIITT